MRKAARLMPSKHYRHSMELRNGGRGTGKCFAVYRGIDSPESRRETRVQARALCERLGLTLVPEDETEGF